MNGNSSRNNINVSSMRLQQGSVLVRKTVLLLRFKVVSMVNSVCWDVFKEDTEWRTDPGGDCVGDL